MNEIKLLRDKLKISQAALAGLLGVRRSALSMAELGKRPLPDHAWKKLYMIEKCLKDFEQLPETPGPEFPVQGYEAGLAIDRIEKQIRDWEYQLREAEYFYNKMLKKYKEMHATYARLKYLETRTDVFDAGSLKHLNIRVWFKEYAATTKVGKTHQGFLEREIAALKFQIAEGEKAIGELGG